MSAEPITVTPTGLSPAQQRSQQVSRALADAARKLRFSSQGRRGHPGGMRARRGRVLVRFLYMGGFALMVVVPTLTTLVYFGLIAADQYESEARFAVRSGAMAGLDPISSILGAPPAQIIQDTQVVTTFIGSRALVDELQKTADLRRVYSREEADWVASLNPEKPIEKVVKYWHTMTGVKIEMPGGIVHLSVRAFRPGDAVMLVNGVLAASERLVNDLNDRSRRDAVSFADQELQLASTRLAQARANLEVARNKEGMLDATAAATSINTIIASVRTEELRLKQQLDSQIASNVSRDAPQMRDLRLRIEASERQVEQLQRELTTVDPGSSPTVSASMTRLAALALQSKVAETQYTTAALALERARMASLTKQIYLTSFVQPVAAEEARYPRRLWICFITFVGGTILWAAFCGIVTFIRNHMA